MASARSASDCSRRSESHQFCRLVEADASLNRREVIRHHVLGGLLARELPVGEDADGQVAVGHDPDGGLPIDEYNAPDGFLLHERRERWNERVWRGGYDVVTGEVFDWHRISPRTWLRYVTKNVLLVFAAREVYRYRPDAAGGNHRKKSVS